MTNNFTEEKAPLLVIFSQSERDLLAQAEGELRSKVNRGNLQNRLTRQAVTLVFSDPKLRKRVIREFLANPGVPAR